MILSYAMAVNSIAVAKLPQINQMQYFEDTDIASNPTSKLLSQYPATGN